MVRSWVVDLRSCCIDVLDFGKFLFFHRNFFFIVVVRVRLRILTIGDAEYLCVKDHHGSPGSRG